MAAAALTAVLAGRTEAEINAEIDQIEARDIVKDFKQSDGADHFSGEGSGNLQKWIKYKRRLRGAMRRANAVFKHMFLGTGANCEIDELKLQALPSSAKELLLDVMTSTLCGTAHGYLIDFENGLDGSGALIFLDKNYVKNDMNERSEVKEALLDMKLGKENPEKKLQEIAGLVRLRNQQLGGAYDDNERISDLLRILKKDKEYDEFRKTLNVIDKSGTHLTNEQFTKAVQDYWRDNIRTDENDLLESQKAPKISTAAAVTSEDSAAGAAEEKGGKSKGKGGGKKGGKKGGGRWNFTGSWNNGQGKGSKGFGGYKGGYSGGGGRGFSSSTEDDERCKWTCPICGPNESTTDWIVGKMHFPDKCPLRNAVRNAYAGRGRGSPSQPQASGITGNQEETPENSTVAGFTSSQGNRRTEPEITFNYSPDIMFAAEAITEPEISFDIDSFSHLTRTISIMDKIRHMGSQFLTLVCLIITMLVGLPKHIYIHQALGRVPFPMVKSVICNLMIASLFLIISCMSWQAGSNYFIDLGVKNFEMKREAYFAGAVSSNGTQAWMVDSGASFGLCCNAKSFKTLNLDAPTKKFRVAAKEMLETKGVGTVEIKVWNSTTKTHDSLEISNVYYSPHQPLNLLSVRQLIEKGYHSPDFESCTFRRKGSKDVYKFQDTGSAYVIPNCEKSDGTFAPVTIKADEIYRSTDNWMLDTELYTAKKLSVSQPEDQWTELFASDFNYQEADHYTESNPYENCTIQSGNYYANPPFKNEVCHDLFSKLEREYDPALSPRVMSVAPKINNASWNKYTSREHGLGALPAASVMFSVHKSETYNPEVLTPCPPSKCNGNTARVVIQGSPWPVEILYRDKFTTGTPDKYDLWHAEHGHPGPELSQQILFKNKSASRGGAIQPHLIAKCGVGDNCPVCRLYKRNKPHLSQLDPSRRVSLSPFEKLHADLITLPVQSADGHRYFATYTCAKTGYVFGQALQKKSDVVFVTEEILYRIKALGHQPKTITVRTDDEEVFVHGRHQEFCRKNNLQLQHSPPYQKESAGQAENTNLQIETIARAIMATTRFPDVYWPLAYRHAVLLKNTRPSSTRDWIIPYKAVHGYDFPDERLYLFGAPAAHYISPSQRQIGKWGLTAKEGIYVGPTTDGNGNLLLNPENGKTWECGEIKINNNLTAIRESLTGHSVFPPFQEFNEKDLSTLSKPEPFCSSNQSLPIYEDSNTTIHSMQRYINEHDEIEGAILVSGGGQEKVWINLRDFLYNRPDEQKQATQNWDKFVAFVNNQNQRGLFDRNWYPVFKMVQGKKNYKKAKAVICIQDPASSTPYGVIWSPRFPKLHHFMDVGDDLIDLEDPPVGLAGAFARFFGSKSVNHKDPNDLENYIEPTTWAEALTYPDADKWKEAMEVLIAHFDRLETFDSSAGMTEGSKPIKSKFVFKLKTIEDPVTGKLKIDKYKIRLVAKGYSQVKGDTFWDTFAPVTHVATCKSLFAISLDKDWYVKGMDTKQAFLNATIQFDAHVQMPEGFTYHGSKVVKLNKTLEGTRQGAHDWYVQQDDVVRKFAPNFIKKSPVDPCLYIYDDGGKEQALIAVHTDDYLIATNSPDWYERFFQYYVAIYPADRKDNVSSYCGIGIEHVGNKILFSQSGKIKAWIDSLKHYANLLPRGTPAKQSAYDLPLAAIKDGSIGYESLIGNALWFSRMTRPDITFATIFHAKFTASANQTHYESALDIPRYLVKTSDYKLQYEKSACTNGKFRVKIQTDSDWASDWTDRKSYQSFIVFLNDKPIMWNSSKQSVVATSSFEAEYMGLAEGVKAGLYLFNLLQTIVEVELPMLLEVDNKAAIAFSESEGCNARTKHVDIRYHFVRDYISQGMFTITHIPSAENLADLLTKILSQEVQAKLTQRLLLPSPE